VDTTENTSQLCLIPVIRFDPGYAGNIFIGNRVLVLDQQSRPFTVCEESLIISRTFLERIKMSCLCVATKTSMISRPKSVDVSVSSIT
jgi:hypothetical protein